MQLRTILFSCLLAITLSMPDSSVAERLSAKSIERLLDSLSASRWEETDSGARPALLLGSRILIDECGSYPYQSNGHRNEGFLNLAADLREGLGQGLMCMAGHGAPGRLHPFHEKNARRLVDLLNDESGKILRCVEDQTFAYAVAHPSKSPAVPHEILIDTYRISGFLSRRFDRQTYRDFFKLSDPLIEDHLTGKPLHLDGMHRYRNLPGLLFHEVTHWLGFEHTNLTADVVDLYETCCFGGSDHILDEAVNRGFQQRACNILRDEELWEADAATRKRLWQQKGYYRLKREIRASRP
jgi:hypothetical protein